MIVRELITLLGFRVNRAQLRTAERATRRISGNLANVGRNLAFFATLPIALGFRGFLSAATNLDLLDKSLRGMLGSADEAKTVMKDVIALAERSPLIQLEDVSKVTRLMVAQGFEAGELVEIIELLSTASSAFGGDLTRLAQNLIQVKAAGRLSGRELRDFEKNMLPLGKALAKNVSIPLTEIRSRATEITFEQVVEALKDIAGPGSKAAAIVNEIAETPFGRLQKLRDQLFKLSATLGDKLLPLANDLLDVGFSLIAMINRLSPDMKRFILILGGVVAAIAPVIGIIIVLLLALSPIGLAVIAIVIAIALLVDELRVWATGGETILGKIFGPWDRFWKNMKKAFKVFLDFWKAQFREFKREFEELIEGFERSFNRAKNLANKIKAFFPEEILSPRGRAAVAGTKTAVSKAVEVGGVVIEPTERLIGRTIVPFFKSIATLGGRLDPSSTTNFEPFLRNRNGGVTPATTIVEAKMENIINISGAADTTAIMDTLKIEMVNIAKDTANIIAEKIVEPQVNPPEVSRDSTGVAR